MKTLVSAHIVQFSLWDYETFQISAGGTAIIGPNGAGKTSLIDAVQIAMVGGHGQHMHFNAQSVHKDARSIRSYALGTMRSGDGENGVITRKRDEALSYISLVFQGKDERDVLSAGICIHATVTDSRTLGLYVFPGVALKLEHHLEDAGDNSKAPIDWELFCHHGRKLSRSAGREPTITSQPESYVRELLHNIQQSVDARRFLRAFGHSINLKAVSSVGDFLRGYLIEATPIDKRGTLQHIKTLRALSQQIEQIKDQIVQLEAIEKSYAKVADLRRKAAVAEAVKLQFASESAGEAAANLEKELTELSQSVENARRDLPYLEELRTTLQNAYEALLQEFSADPDAQQPAQLLSLRQARSSTVLQTRKEVNRISLQVRMVLQEISDSCDGETSNWIKEVKQNLDIWDGWAKSDHIANVSQTEQVLDLLRGVNPLLQENLESACKVAGSAKKASLSSEGKLKALSQGNRITDGNVARAVALFSSAGITCVPVAELVQVIDIRWQGPIETFLGPHRLALLVQEGSEDEAVELIRREKINDVTIIQPEHLKNEIDRTVASDTVAALLQGENKVALAYLRRILGRMKRVETAAELRREDRALTMDYMLSANGGTKRIRPLPEDRWVLGVKLTNEDRSAILEENRKVLQMAREAEQRVGKLASASNNLQSTIQQVTKTAYEAAFTSHQIAVTELDATPDPDTIPVPDRVAVLQFKLKTAKSDADKSKKDYEDRNAEFTKLSTHFDNLKPQLESRREEYQKLQQQLAEAVTDIDWDHELASAEYDRISAMVSEDIGDALEDLYSKRQTWLKNISSIEQEARDDFIDFINDHSIELFDERNDWQLAHKWVVSHIGKLKDSTLANYETEAQAARQAAEDSFKSDVKFKMREAIHRVRQEIRDLNKILEICPAFTNGEKYQFVANISPAHRSLHELIVNSSGDSEIDLFSQPETQVNIMALLEASESGQDKGNNPLEDYRLLFNFDLEIRQDGKVVDLLSKRMGVASNGEHRVPFYVIAGAALATAYRIRPGVERSGAGLMILDEAFYGMDAQNTFVTAEFLKNLGLQLLMAGPDSDVGKLAPLLDNYYDLVRYGADVFVEQVRVKEPARRLLSSDIPLLHQELLDVQEAQLIADAL
ncbi:SbcC/MukB-like Walker B domain-containing protein [Methylomonas sp. TEB]|uniref:SbcC/MukB-like Walker B domain-containing protein n=1 Tax=Methylomonas sp. TEB TaxID=3398229 RepID=UPI0039F62903